MKENISEQGIKEKKFNNPSWLQNKVLQNSIHDFTKMTAGALAIVKGKHLPIAIVRNCTVEI